MPRKKTWLRHPARTITEPRKCPTGKTRFASVEVAQQAIPTLVVPRVAAVACDECKGAHHETLPPHTQGSL